MIREYCRLAGFGYRGVDMDRGHAVAVVKIPGERKLQRFTFPQMAILAAEAKAKGAK